VTGPVPIADQEFAALREGVALNGVVTSAIVLVILWLALRSLRIVAAVVVSVFVGLTVTAAVGLLLVGALNPISMAFVVLFVGLGADFAIQFSVRYRSERHADDSLRGSLIRAARRVGAPLTLAAAAAAAGFLSFLPTSYRGLAELGSIRRGRHGDCVCRQHDAVAGVALAARPSAGAKAPRLCRIGSGRPFSSAAPDRGGRRHVHRCARRIAVSSSICNSISARRVCRIRNPSR
jgi:MMPL family